MNCYSGSDGGGDDVINGEQEAILGQFWVRIGFEGLTHTSETAADYRFPGTTTSSEVTAFAWSILGSAASPSSKPQAWTWGNSSLTISNQLSQYSSEMYPILEFHTGGAHFLYSPGKREKRIFPTWVRHWGFNDRVCKLYLFIPLKTILFSNYSNFWLSNRGECQFHITPEAE